MHIEKKTLRNLFFGVAGCILLIWILNQTDNVKAVVRYFKNLLMPFMWGAAIAFILNVPMRGYEKLLKRINRAKLRRLIALALTIVSVLLVLTIIFLLLIPQMTETLGTLIDRLPEFAEETESRVTNFLNAHPKIKTLLSESQLESINGSNLFQNAAGLVSKGLTLAVDTAISAAGSIASGLMDAFIAVVFAIYCLFQKETLARQCKKLLYAFLPEGKADYTIRVMRMTNSTFSNFLTGQCIEVCILGGMFAIAMAIFRMPYIPLVSMLVAVTAFIPVVGAWAGCILGAFFILVEDPMLAVWFVVMFLVLQQIENNMIYPKVVGNSIGLSGMWVLVAVGVGGGLMGFAGMFIMIPITSVLYTLVSEFTNKRFASKNIDPKKLEAECMPEDPKQSGEKKNKKIKKEN